MQKSNAIKNTILFYFKGLKKPKDLLIHCFGEASQNRYPKFKHLSDILVFLMSSNLQF